MEIAVNHDKKDYNSYQVLDSGVISNGYSYFTTTWNVTATGTYYIEFRIADSEKFWHFVGAWYEVVRPVLHDFQVGSRTITSAYVATGASHQKSNTVRFSTENFESLLFFCII